jgi:hypothetical protein
MKIIRIRGTCYWDVFLGEGWNHWSRVKIVNGAITLTDGQTLHSGLLREIVQHG